MRGRLRRRRLATVIFVYLLVFLCSGRRVLALSTKTKNNIGSTGRNQKQQSSRTSLHTVLQKSFTPQSILKDVAIRLIPQNDPLGTLSSLTLIRLSKQLIHLDNQKLAVDYDEIQQDNTDPYVSLFPLDTESLWNGLNNTVYCSVNADWTASTQSVEFAVEGIKALAVICRLLRQDQRLHFSNIDCLWIPLLDKLDTDSDKLSRILLPHQLSGLKWAMDCCQLVSTTTTSSNTEQPVYRLPTILQKEYDDLNLPFRILPGFLGSTSAVKKDYFSVIAFVDEVDFQVDTVRTFSNLLVQERRKTAWQGDDNVAPFSYSGKFMARLPWSPMVRKVRDYLLDKTSQYYDGCLLNLYPDGGSGMNYHIDPDQGSLWGYETAVVSIGATRRFAFRAIARNGSFKSACKPHVFVLMNGDVTEMFNDCQKQFQHTVKSADKKDETAPRVSLVFKKTLVDMRE